MRITSKGQVTIPAEVREKLGLLPNTEVRIRARGSVAVLEKVTSRHTRGAAIVARLEGRATKRLTTDQIMALTRGE